MAFRQPMLRPPKPSKGKEKQDRKEEKLEERKKGWWKEKVGGAGLLESFINQNLDAES